MNTGCKKDEDFGSKWGSGTKTAKMMAAQTCSDNGYYSWTIRDCNDWKFEALCRDSIPADWSPPISDEAAREKGFKDRNAYALAKCIEKGYNGIDANQFRDRGEWAFSVKCVRPEWFGNDWNNDGCQADGSKRYARKVNAQGMRWEEAADWLILNQSPKINDTWKGGKVTKVFRENKGVSGMWVIVIVQDDECATKDCKKDEDFGTKWGPAGKTAKMMLAQECSDKGFYNWDIIECKDWKFKAQCRDSIPADWSPPISDEAAREKGFEDRNDFATAKCIEKGFVGINSNEWKDHGEWAFSVKCIKPDWKGASWNDDGCQSPHWFLGLLGIGNGLRRFARQVDAKGLSWELAADWMIENKVPKEGEIFEFNGVEYTIAQVSRDNKGAAGMWVYVDVPDYGCMWGIVVLIIILIICSSSSSLGAMISTMIK